MIRPLVASTRHLGPVRGRGTWTPAPPLPTRLAWLIAVTRHLAGARP